MSGVHQAIHSRSIPSYAVFKYESTLTILRNVGRGRCCLIGSSLFLSPSPEGLVVRHVVANVLTDCSM